MAKRKASVIEKRRLAAARLKRNRVRTVRAFRTPIPHDADASLVGPSNASAASALQSILSERDDAELSDMEEDQQDKITRMHIQKALASTLKWFQAFQREIEKMRCDIKVIQTDLSQKHDTGA